MNTSSYDVLSSSIVLNLYVFMLPLCVTDIITPSVLQKHLALRVRERFDALLVAAAQLEGIHGPDAHGDLHALASREVTRLAVAVERLRHGFLEASAIGDSLLAPIVLALHATIVDGWRRRHLPLLLHITLLHPIFFNYIEFFCVFLNIKYAGLQVLFQCLYSSLFWD